MEGDIDIRRGNKTAFRDHCHSEPSGAPMTALRTAGCRSEGGRELGWNLENPRNSILSQKVHRDRLQTRKTKFSSNRLAFFHAEPLMTDKPRLVCTERSGLSFARF